MEPAVAAHVRNPLLLAVAAVLAVVVAMVIYHHVQVVREHRLACQFGVALDGGDQNTARQVC